MSERKVNCPSWVRYAILWVHCCFNEVTCHLVNSLSTRLSTMLADSYRCAYRTGCDGANLNIITLVPQRDEQRMRDLLKEQQMNKGGTL